MTPLKKGGFPCLKTGTTIDFFQSSGTIPVFIEHWKISVKGFVKWDFKFFMKIAHKPSAPVENLFSKLDIAAMTSISVIWMGKISITWLD